MTTLEEFPSSPVQADKIRIAGPTTYAGLQIRIDDSGDTFFVYYYDFRALILARDEALLVIDHITGRFVIEGEFLDTLALAIHEDRVQRISSGTHGITKIEFQNHE